MFCSCVAHICVLLNSFITQTRVRSAMSAMMRESEILAVTRWQHFWQSLGGSINHSIDELFEKTNFQTAGKSLTLKGNPMFQ